MTLDYKIVKHACNVFKREVNSAYPDFQIAFIVHENNQRHSTYLKEKGQLLNHPAGKKLCQILENEDKTIKGNKSTFAGIAEKKSSSFLGFSKKNNVLALCALNISSLDSVEEAKNLIRHLGWLAINAYIQNEIQPNFEKDFIYAPKKETLLRHKLNADIFTYTLHHTQKNKKDYDNFCKEKLNLAINKSDKINAEDYPFAICIDTLDVILRNRIEHYEKLKNNILIAYNITKDISETYDDFSLRNWKHYAIPAQIMAWENIPPTKILGAAIYTSENTFVQSIADLSAEKLKIKPEIYKPLNAYNPFANQKTNERVHKKLCLENYKHIIKEIKSCADYKIFLSHALKENKKLCDKFPLGWCAHGLIKAAEILIHTNNENDYHQCMKRAQEAFDTEIENLKWDTIENFGKNIFALKRHKKNITLEDIQTIARKNEEYGSIYHTLTYNKNS